MCNLSQGILEQGIEQGIDRGENRMAELIRRLHETGREGELMKAACHEDYRRKLYGEFGI